MRSVHQQVRDNEEKLMSAESELGSIKATIIVNYGPNSKDPIIKDETANTLSMFMDVLTKMNERLGGSK